jgi:hypothetical protein
VGLGALVEIERAEQVAVVGHGDRLHAAFEHLREQLVQPNRAVQKAILRVQMEVRELGHEEASLALRAPLIQRKSIHSLPTGALVAAIMMTAVGCAGGRAATMSAGDRVLVPDSATIKISPRSTGSARFVLTSGRVPIAGQTVTFSIPDLPMIEGTEAKGSTLLETSAVTDVDGVASVDVQVQDATVFHVVASVEGAKDSDLAVIVALEAGSVEVAPFFAAGSNGAGAAASIDVRLFDGKPCSSINLANPGSTSRLTVNVIAPAGATTQFDVVSTAETNAVVADAHDGHGIAVAVGCADLLGSSLVPGGVVRLALRLDDTVASPVGRFAVTSRLAFAPALAAAQTINGAWRDLTDCPLDPAQLLLDCMIDALSPETADDPLDCRPNLAPGGERPLGDALLRRRGVPIVDATGAVTSCRGARDASGAPSLDSIALGLFGTPTPALIVALPAIGEDAAHMLDSVQLGSTLIVQPSGRVDEYVVTHTLDTASFRSPLTTVDVPLAPLGLPALTAYTTAVTRDGQLVMNEHGFSLRLGTIARAGFGGLALQPRLPPQTPADVGGLITEILKLASISDGKGGKPTSCAAFDALLCPIAGAPQPCFADACSQGLLALKARLEGVFGAADGTGLDLTLSGSAPLLDMHGGGFAHQLGANLDDPSAPANWYVDLRTASGRAQLITSFVGVRE